MKINSAQVPFAVNLSKWNNEKYRLPKFERLRSGLKVKIATSCVSGKRLKRLFTMRLKPSFIKYSSIVFKILRGKAKWNHRSTFSGYAIINVVQLFCTRHDSGYLMLQNSESRNMELFKVFAQKNFFKHQNATRCRKISCKQMREFFLKNGGLVSSRLEQLNNSTFLIWWIRAAVYKLFRPRATHTITHLFEGRTSYVTWLFRERLHSNKSQIFSYIIFSSLTKWLCGPDELASRAAFGPRAAVWRPLN